MAQFFESMNDVLPNKITIVMHIVAYLFIIVANASQIMTNSDFREYEISNICLLVVYFVCTLIFGIVNTIVAKIEIATDFTESMSSSLIDSVTTSFLGSV